MKVKNITMFSEAWLWLAVARMMLLLVPFRKLAPVLGKKTALSFPAERIATHNERLRQLGRAIRRAGNWSPWRTQCFEQVLAAKCMLKCRGMASTVFFGVSQNQKKKQFCAHAWLESEGLVVTGGEHLEQYTVIASFKS